MGSKTKRASTRRMISRGKPAGGGRAWTMESYLLVVLDFLHHRRGGGNGSGLRAATDEKKAGKSGEDKKCDGFVHKALTFLSAGGKSIGD